MWAILSKVKFPVGWLVIFAREADQISESSKELL